MSDAGFMPHGMCFLWHPDVLTLHVISDALIATAYFSIPALLLWFIRHRRDLGGFTPVLSMFGVFIVACGATHVMAIWTIWHPDYWIDGALKAVTAAASVGTALMMVPLLPKALALRSPAELERVNADLEHALHDLARERHIATTFQTAALTAVLPAVDGIVMSAVYAPAVADLQIGGDWYDAFELADGRVVLTIGDVTGNGLAASVIMAKVRQSLRAAASMQIDPGAILDAAHNVLRNEYPDRIVTAFVAIVDQIESTLTYAGAGHPWPLLRRADGTIEELATLALPLGLRDADAPAAQSITLAEDDMLVLFTDGLVEATHDLAAGEERLRTAIATVDVVATVDAARTIAEAVLDGPARDDVAVLTATIKQHARSTSRVDRWTFESTAGVQAAGVRAEVRRILTELGANATDTVVAEMVFSELVGNVYRYAPGAVEVVLEQSGGRAVLHVLDRGAGFRFLPKLPADPLSERGRGLFLVSSLTEDFHIHYRPGGGSHARAVLVFASRTLTHRGELSTAR